MLEVNGLYKEYANKKIGPFYFKFKKNQTIAIIGKSGSGKSTLIKLITGVIKKDDGNSLLNKKPLTKADFTYISQIGTLFNHLKILDNLRLTYKGSLQDIIKTLEEVNLNESFLYKYPFELSGGERQRIDLVRAIVAKTKLIILDEALSALDTRTKDDIYEILKGLRAKHNLMILIVTHDLDEALYLADKIIVLDEGKITFNDTSTNLLNEENQNINNLINSHRLERLKKVYINE